MITSTDTTWLNFFFSIRVNGFNEISNRFYRRQLFRTKTRIATNRSSLCATLEAKILSSQYNGASRGACTLHINSRRICEENRQISWENEKLYFPIVCPDRDPWSSFWFLLQISRRSVYHHLLNIIKICPYYSGHVGPDSLCFENILHSSTAHFIQ